MGYVLFGGSDIVMVFQEDVSLKLLTNDHILMGEPGIGTTVLVSGTVNKTRTCSLFINSTRHQCCRVDRLGIMVVLRNIKREEGKISAEFYPENRNVHGFIEVAYPSGDILRFDKAPGWKSCQISGVHARDELLRMYESPTLPEERTILWY